MTTLPEEAVKAAVEAVDEGVNWVAGLFGEKYDNAEEVMTAALTAALPFLPVQGAQLSPKDRNTAEVGGLVDTLRSMSHDDNTRACVSVNITVSNDLAKKLFDVLHAAQKAATALEAQEAELAAVHQRYVDADESRIDAEAALAEARKALEQAEQQLDYGQVNAAHRILIRALSSPDHAGAGKVEGDGEKWPMRELIAKAMAYQSVGDPHAKTVHGNQRWEWFVEDADKFINAFGYYLPALPSAPASEGAE